MAAGSSKENVDGSDMPERDRKDCKTCVCIGNVGDNVGDAVGMMDMEGVGDGSVDGCVDVEGKRDGALDSRVPVGGKDFDGEVVLGWMLGNGVLGVKLGSTVGPSLGLHEGMFDGTLETVGVPVVGICVGLNV